MLPARSFKLSIATGCIAMPQAALSLRDSRGCLHMSLSCATLRDWTVATGAPSVDWPVRCRILETPVGESQAFWANRAGSAGRCQTQTPVVRWSGASRQRLAKRGHYCRGTALGNVATQGQPCYSCPAEGRQCELLAGSSRSWPCWSAGEPLQALRAGCARNRRRCPLAPTARWSANTASPATTGI